LNSYTVCASVHAGTTPQEHAAEVTCAYNHHLAGHPTSEPTWRYIHQQPRNPRGSNQTDIQSPLV